MTPWLVFHFGSGHACFSGAACVLAAVGIVAWRPEGRARRLGFALGWVGLILAAASAAPLPVWMSVVLYATTFSWLVLPRRHRGRAAKFLPAAVAAAWLAAVGLELPYQAMPTLRPVARPVLGIVGDSLTAGLGERDGVVTWPRRLAAAHGIEVRDHARMGTTVASAASQADAVTPEETVVLLEIGGNDLLGGTTPAAFETGLRSLLERLRRPGRTLVMLELPLPPGFNAFGEIQRRLARESGVRLVPRRVLMGVLTGKDATLDSVHLSQTGHARMAAAMWRVLPGAWET